VCAAREKNSLFLRALPSLASLYIWKRKTGFRPPDSLKFFLFAFACLRTFFSSADIAQFFSVPRLSTHFRSSPIHGALRCVCAERKYLCCLFCWPFSSRKNINDRIRCFVLLWSSLAHQKKKNRQTSLLINEAKAIWRERKERKKIN
jgi:hypothetical protein